MHMTFSDIARLKVSEELSDILKISQRSEKGPDSPRSERRSNEDCIFFLLVLEGVKLVLDIMYHTMVVSRISRFPSVLGSQIMSTILFKSLF